MVVRWGYVSAAWRRRQGTHHDGLREPRLVAVLRMLEVHDEVHVGHYRQACDLQRDRTTAAFVSCASLAPFTAHAGHLLVESDRQPRV